MMYDVRPLAAAINVAPATEIDEILQNVAVILSTVRYTVPYDRRFGLNPQYLDDPLPVTRARATADIIEAVRYGEPRAKIAEVTFEGDAAAGVLRPVVKVSIDG